MERPSIPGVAWPPARNEVVLRYLLERNAAAEPDRVAMTFHTGERWTAAELLEQVYRGANGFRSRGIGQGDVVGVFGKNGPELVRAIFGLQCLGATLVPMNGAWRGGLLRHAIDTTQPALVVAGEEHAARVAECGSATPTIDNAELDLSDPSASALDGPIEPWDPAVYLFTSGTTGPSKAAVLSHQHLFMCGAWVTVDAGLGPDDTFLIDLPLTHATGLTISICSISIRTTVAVRELPSLANYWEVARETGASAAVLLSSMVPVLLSKPSSDRDRDHNFKFVVASPLPPDVEAFKDRFGIGSVLAVYGSTETGGPIVTYPGDPIVPFSAGHARAGWELRIVDEHDLEVPNGTVGELVVRSEPWCLNNGYVNNPEATASAWRNGWFHTGDLMTRDDDGNFFFVDRAKDALRRRGENISSYEVEVEVAAFPAVAEVACVGVNSHAGVSDEVKVWIVPQPDAVIDFPELVEFLIPRMPHYMLPRYYETVDELPKSPTLKVQKFVLRDRGNSDATWDLEVDGGFRTTSGGVARVDAAPAS